VFNFEQAIYSRRWYDAFVARRLYLNRWGRNMSTAGVAPAHEVEPAGQLQLNVLSLRADATVSTFGNRSAGHSIIAASTFFNTVFHRTKFESAQFVACEFGGTVMGRSDGRLRG
jgi:hypothetical protein